MMYLALTYDHRLLDGREAVVFLVKVKLSIPALLSALTYLTGQRIYGRSKADAPRLDDND